MRGNTSATNQLHSPVRVVPDPFLLLLKARNHGGRLAGGNCTFWMERVGSPYIWSTKNICEGYETMLMNWLGRNIDCQWIRPLKYASLQSPCEVLKNLDFVTRHFCSSSLYIQRGDDTRCTAPAILSPDSRIISAAAQLQSTAILSTVIGQSLTEEVYI